MEPKSTPTAAEVRDILRAAHQISPVSSSTAGSPSTTPTQPPKPSAPRSCFHQTLFRVLDKQPLAETLEQLQEQIDRFD